MARVADIKAMIKKFIPQNYIFFFANQEPRTQKSGQTHYHDLVCEKMIFCRKNNYLCPKL